MELTEQQKQAMEILKVAVRNYKASLNDDLGILTVVTEELGYQAYPGQSMLDNTDICHFIDNDNHLLDIIFDEAPDEDTLQSIKGDDELNHLPIVNDVTGFGC